MPHEAGTGMGHGITSGIKKNHNREINQAVPEVDSIRSLRVASEGTVREAARPLE